MKAETLEKLTGESPTREFYRTPPALTLDMLTSWWPLHESFSKRNRPLRILEPCAGDGAILDVLRVFWPAAEIDAFDIAPAASRPDIITRPFYMADEGRRYDLVVMNPPGSQAEAFVRQAWELADVVLSLMRNSFQGEQVRADLFREHMPHQIWTIGYRPSFTGDGKTDWTSWAWFEWDRAWTRDYAEWRRLEAGGRAAGGS